MYPYQQAYQPAYAFRMAQQAPPAQLPQAPAAALPGLTSGQRTGAIVLGSAETVFGVAAAWVGVRAGLREKGLFSVLGWVVAGGGALVGLINLVGTLGVAKS